MSEGFSVLARFLVKNPMEFEVLAPGSKPWKAGWQDCIRAYAVSDSGQIDMSLLRRASHAALMQVAVRDLISGDPMALVDDIASELSHLADTVPEYTLERARTEVPGFSSVRIVVVTVGKAGAEELSYISDVDVIHVAEPVGGVDHGEVMRVGARVVAAMARTCSAHTSEGTI